MGNDVKNFVDRPFFKILGWICTIASLLTGIYFACLYKPSPHFEYEIISRTKILNKDVDVASIRVMIDSTDIQRDSLNISIMEIKISNTGREHLRREDYDNSLFGLKITNGVLLEKPELSCYSTDHILRCYKEHSFGVDSMFIPIPTIPLDSKDYYQFKLVILHRINERLSFIPFGKIIGQREISVLETRRVDESFWKKVFYGNIIIHVFRFIIYLIIVIAIIWITFSISEQIEKKKFKRKKNKLVTQFRNNKKLDNEVVNDFVIMPSADFIMFVDLIKLPEGELYNKYKASINYTKNEKNQKNRIQWSKHSRRYSVIRMMLEKDYIKIEGERLQINQKKKKTLLTIMQEAIDTLYSDYGLSLLSTKK